MGIEVLFRCDHRVGFVLPPHIESEVGEITKKPMLQRIIEEVVWRTVKGRVSKCNKVCVEVMTYYGGGMIDDRCRAIESLWGCN